MDPPAAGALHSRGDAIDPLVVAPFGGDHGRLLLAGTLVLWSFNFTALRYAVSHGISPLTYSPLRWILAGTALSTFTYRLERSVAISRRDLVAVGALAAVGLWLKPDRADYASKLTTAATVALLFGTLPVFVALFSRAAGIERVTRRQWLAVLVSFVGVGLIAGGAGAPVSTHVWGILLGLTTAASFAVYSVAMVPMMRRYSPYRLNALTALVGAVLLAATGTWQLAHQDWHVDALTWGALVYMAPSRRPRSATCSGSRRRPRRPRPRSALREPPAVPGRGIRRRLPPRRSILSRSPVPSPSEPRSCSYASADTGAAAGRVVAGPRRRLRARAAARATAWPARSRRRERGASPRCACGRRAGDRPAGRRA